MITRLKASLALSHTYPIPFHRVTSNTSTFLCYPTDGKCISGVPFNRLLKAIESVLQASVPGGFETATTPFPYLKSQLPGQQMRVRPALSFWSNHKYHLTKQIA